MPFHDSFDLLSFFNRLNPQVETEPIRSRPPNARSYSAIARSREGCGERRVPLPLHKPSRLFAPMH
jgi:hypothetical protein